MKHFNYETAINQLGLDKKQIVNKNLNLDKMPEFANLTNFKKLFLPYVKIICDSREQDRWLEDYAKYYGIQTISAKKGNERENLKEGDYTFVVDFGNQTFDFTGIVSYERKGNISEFYRNCQQDRKRVKREFDRFGAKQYEKVVLMLQFGEQLTDLINLKFYYYEKGEDGKPKQVSKNTHHTMFSTVMSWKQPNNNNFDIIQSANKTKLFWLMLLDMYYFFRNYLREECIAQDLIEVVE